MRETDYYRLCFEYAALHGCDRDVGGEREKKQLRGTASVCSNDLTVPVIWIRSDACSGIARI